MKNSQLIAASMPQLHTETYLVFHQYNVHTIEIKLLILKNTGQKPLLLPRYSDFQKIGCLKHENL